jgi:phage terminase small subunit
MKKARSKSLYNSINSFKQKNHINVDTPEQSSVAATVIIDAKKKININTAEIANDNDNVIKTSADLKIFLKNFSLNHKLFSDAYLTCLNATKSYRIAYPNCSEQTAWRRGYDLIRHDKVVAYITYMYAKKQEKYTLSFDKNIKELEKIKQISLAAVPVLDKHGKPIGTYKTNTYAAAKCQELISKMLGLDQKYAKKSDRDLNNNIVIVKAYVVPQLRNIVHAPESSEQDIKELIEDYLKERAK